MLKSVWTGGQTESSDCTYSKSVANDVKPVIKVLDEHVALSGSVSSIAPTIVLMMKILR